MCYFFNNVRPLIECYYYVRTSVLSTPFAHALLLRSCVALSVSWTSPPVYHKARILSSIFFYFFYTLCVAHYAHFVKLFWENFFVIFLTTFAKRFCGDLLLWQTRASHIRRRPYVARYTTMLLDV
jgi:hypothetical protein